MWLRARWAGWPFVRWATRSTRSRCAYKPRAAVLSLLLRPAVHHHAYRRRSCSTATPGTALSRPSGALPHLLLLLLVSRRSEASPKHCRWEGIGGLYKGVASPLVGQMFFRACLFTCTLLFNAFASIFLFQFVFLFLFLYVYNSIFLFLFIYLFITFFLYF